ncbi:MAG: type II toxin-antitoxin system VapC family toxin, partial [Gammaproteobacteria bacterium]|nr:type II toxin-antitoxin system VapC family toxin [Gammaproteobacteria bacterium]
MATYQEIIRAWWANARGTYKLVALVLVTVEDSAGDPDAAALRVAMLEGVSLLDATMEVEELSKSLITNSVIPRQAAGDVTHIAIAATSGVDYFVTWNFRHIANAAMRARIEDICRQAGYDPVVICTPNKLM